MRSRRKAIGTNAVFVSVVVVLIVAILGITMLAYPSIGPPVSSASSMSSTSSLLLSSSSASSSSASSMSSASSTESSTASSIDSAAGLQLQITLNSTSIPTHSEASVRIDLTNTLGQNVSLPVTANGNISAWNSVDFFCGLNPSHSLVGFALFAGDYSAHNISAAGSPLQLAAPVVVPCPFALPLNDTTFLPNSNEAISFSYYGQTQEPSYPVSAEVNASTGYCAGSLLIDECQTTSGILGYWNHGFGYTDNMTLTSNDFTYLPAGEYTVVAMDDWNQTAYAHFQVTG